MFWAGIFIGALLGFCTMAICKVSGDASRLCEKESKGDINGDS